MKRTLTHLSKLVAFDTRNPPRDPARVAELHAYAAHALVACGFTIVEDRDLGEGSRWLLVSRGADAGRPLVNIHTDTVPIASGWQTNPFDLSIVSEDGLRTRSFDPDDQRALSAGSRAVGLGSCDIKGALAAFLAAAEVTKGPGSLLLTSDEEAGQSRCVRTFVGERSVANLDVIVAEPTACQAVCVHRGIGTCTGLFRGASGHASGPSALADSASHQAVRWAARALDLAMARPELRFNLGVIEGGVKANMIASSCRVTFGVRPAFGIDSRTVVDEICALAPDQARVEWTPGYVGPPLPAPGRRSNEAERLVAALGLKLGPPVDFFTEAALFSEAGACALVWGPGDIAQAHTAGEWIELAQLAEAERTWARLLAGAP